MNCYRVLETNPLRFANIANDVFFIVDHTLIFRSGGDYDGDGCVDIGQSGMSGDVVRLGFSVATLD